MTNNDGSIWARRPEDNNVIMMIIDDQLMSLMASIQPLMTERIEHEAKEKLCHRRPMLQATK